MTNKNKKINSQPFSKNRVGTGNEGSHLIKKNREGRDVCLVLVSG